MRDSFSFLSKLLALTSSSNKNEKAAAQQKLEQLLKKYGITKHHRKNFKPVHNMLSFATRETQ